VKFRCSKIKQVSLMVFTHIQSHTPHTPNFLFYMLMFSLVNQGVEIYSAEHMTSTLLWMYCRLWYKSWTCDLRGMTSSCIAGGCCFLLI